MTRISATLWGTGESKPKRPHRSLSQIIFGANFRNRLALSSVLWDNP